jgi:hypothetical protein
MIVKLVYMPVTMRTRMAGSNTAGGSPKLLLPEVVEPESILLFIPGRDTGTGLNK